MNFYNYNPKTNVGNWTVDKQVLEWDISLDKEKSEFTYSVTGTDITLTLKKQ